MVSAFDRVINPQNKTAKQNGICDMCSMPVV